MRLFRRFRKPPAPASSPSTSSPPVAARKGKALTTFLSLFVPLLFLLTHRLLIVVNVFLSLSVSSPFITSVTTNVRSTDICQTDVPFELTLSNARWMIFYALFFHWSRSSSWACWLLMIALCARTSVHRFASTQFSNAKTKPSFTLKGIVVSMIIGPNVWRRINCYSCCCCCSSHSVRSLLEVFDVLSAVAN